MVLNIAHVVVEFKESNIFGHREKLSAKVNIENLQCKNNDGLCLCLPSFVDSAALACTTMCQECLLNASLIHNVHRIVWLQGFLGENIS